MTRSAVLIGVLGMAAALGGCYSPGYPFCTTVCGAPYPPAHPLAYAPLPAYGPPPWDDPFVDYFQRTLTVSTTAGNAEAANTVLQTATPWPRYSNNTNIPGNGPNTVRAYNNYANGTAAAGPSGGGAAGGGVSATPASGGQ
jgi:hypothetical protein